MDGMNSRYKRPDNGTTIRTNTSGNMYSDDMSIMDADNNLKSRQTQRASATRGHSGRGAARTKKQTIIYLIIIIIEVFILAGIWTVYFTSASGSKKSSKKSESASSSEDNSSSSGSVNVNNDNFTLTCTKVSITTDTNGGPAALIYFTFVNKTDSPLSMSQVFAPSITQNGTVLSDSVTLAQEPQELYNRDTPLSNGDSLECAYAFSLMDSTSVLTLTMHDNYETFSDIGSTEIPISQ